MLFRRAPFDSYTVGVFVWDVVSDVDVAAD